MINNIKKAEEDFSRITLNYVYFKHGFSRGAKEFQGVRKSEKYKYQIHIPLVVDENNTPVFSSITIKNISPQGNEKAVVITSDKRNDCYKDQARFGEFVFLLAAKLKYDLWDGLDYDKAGFLYSRELVRLINKSKTTKVPPSILRGLRRFYNKSPNPILKNLFFGRNQLWHLICCYGETHSDPKENKLMWWLNVSPEDIQFLDKKKKPVSHSKLKSLLGHIFPEKYLIKRDEFDEFINILYGEKTKRLKADKKAELIIRPNEIGGADKTKVHPPDEDYHATDLLEEHKTIVGRTAQKKTIKEFIIGKDRGILLVTGPPGIGKTALLANLVHELSPIAAGGSVVSFFFSRESAGYSLRTCWRSLYLNLARKSGLFIDQPANESDALALQFAELLQRLTLERQATEQVQRSKYDTYGQSAKEGNHGVAFDTSVPEIFIVDAIDEAEDPALFLRLIPKPLPHKTFFILSSRPGSYIEGFSALPGAGTHIIVEPRSSENIADARNFLRKYFPDWSDTVVGQIAARADGNFLFLKLFADFINRESIEETKVTAWCDKFGATEKDPLRALYERYWLYLHDKCSQSIHPEDSDDINDLIGLLASTYTPISLSMIRRFLGKQWTTARFERVLKYVRQFMLITSGCSEKSDSRGKMYRLFHDTFKSFVSERLSVDLPRLHGRIVNAYCKKGRKEIDVSHIDNYGLNYVIKHAGLSEERSLAMSLVTPAFLRYKTSCTKSVVPALNDLTTLIEVAAEQRDFRSTLKYTFVREFLNRSNKRKTLGVEAILRARADEGETEVAVADASFFGDADDELLVRTELLLRYWKDDPEFAKGQLLQIDLLSATCSADSSRIGSSKRCVSPASLEAAVIRIAHVCPPTALHLASAIPEPQWIDHTSAGFENPNWGRAVWAIITTYIRNGHSDVDELIEGLQNEFQRSFTLVAFGAQMFTKDLTTAINAFQKALSYVEDDDRVFLLFVIFRYCLWHFPSLSHETAVASLDALLRLGSVRITCPEFALAVDQSIEAHPDAWADLVRGLEEGDARDVINWRLGELGQCPILEPEGFKDQDIKDIARAIKIGRLGHRNPVAAVKLADDIDTLLGYARAVAKIAKAVRQYDRSRAESLIEYFLKSHAIETNSRSFWAVLELVKSVVYWPGATRRNILTWCSNVAQRVKPEILRSDANLALNKLLGRAVVKAAPNESVFFKEIIHEIGTEVGRKILATRILEELPENFCHTIAQNLTSFELGATDFDVLNPQKYGFFLPETKAGLLSLLAWRIGSADPKRARELMLQASVLCASLENEDDRDDVGAKLVRTAFRLSPNLALDVFQQCSCSSLSFQWGVRQVLVKLIESANQSMSRFVRLEWEADLNKRQRKIDDLYWKKRYYALRQTNFPSIGSSFSKDPKLTREWLSELPAFFRKSAHYFSSDSYDVREMGKIAAIVMQLDWPTFMEIVREPEFGPLLCRQISIPDLRLTVFSSDLPASLLLGDVRDIAAVMSGKDNDQGSWYTEVQSYLVVAAASVDPGLCIKMVKSVSPNLRCEFRHDLRDFTPKVFWDEATLAELFTLFDATPEKTEALLTKARLLAWLGTNVQVSQKYLEAIAGEAEELPSALAINVIAACLGELDTFLRDKLVKVALKRAVEMRNAKVIVHVLEAHKSLVDRSWLQSLAIAREVDSATEEHRVLYRIVKLQAKVDVSEAIQTLSLMRTDDNDMEDALDAIAKAIANGSETEVSSWINRIQVLKNLTESHRISFIRTLINRRIKSGIDVSEDLLNSLSGLDDWVEVYLRIHKPATEAETALFEKKLSSRIASSVSFNDREEALRISAGYYVTNRPVVAFRFYKMALQQASKIRPGTVFLFCVYGIVKACLWLPEKNAVALVTDLDETVRGYSFGKDYRDDPLDKARALLVTSVAFWPHDQARANLLLKEAIQEFCEKSQPKSSDSLGNEIHYGITLLVDYRGFDIGKAWIHSCIKALSRIQQQRIADYVCSSICDSHGDADKALEKLGVWQKRLKKTWCMMLEELLPMCSESGKAKCHFAFAITHWGSDQNRVLREIDLVLRNIEIAGGKSSRYTGSHFWITYAAAHGTEGVLRAMFELARAGSLGTEIDHLLSVAVSSSEHSSELVNEVWEALQQTELFIKVTEIYT